MSLKKTEGVFSRTSKVAQHLSVYLVYKVLMCKNVTARGIHVNTGHNKFDACVSRRLDKRLNLCIYVLLWEIWEQISEKETVQDTIQFTL